MDISKLAGTWMLTGTASIDPDKVLQVEFTEGKKDSQGVENWLSGKGHELLDRLEPTEGLSLAITLNKKFTEKKLGFDTPNVRWFGEDGVLAPEVIPFVGYLNIQDSRVFLLTKDSKDEKLRYDDGDTKIVDSVERGGQELIRTVSVVTDELYLDRVLMVYRKAE
ncbi:MAG: hypothetical protein ACFBSC_15350 [Microcoleaceae cyanobacterium]